MATRNKFNTVQICGVTVIATMILCIILTAAPHVTSGMRGDLRDGDIMAIDD